MTMTDSSGKSPKASGVVGIAFVILAVLVLVVAPLLPGAVALVESAFAQIQSSTASTPSTDSSDEEPDGSDKPEINKTVISQEFIDKLTVSTIPEDAYCVTGADGLVSYHVEALDGLEKTDENPNPRLWTDAPGSPILATDPEQARDELQQDDICHDPLRFVAYMTFIATDLRNWVLDEYNVDLLELNPELEPFADQLANIHTLAAEYMPLLDVKLDVDDMTEEQVQLVTEAITQNLKFQKDAAWLNAFLDRAKVVGFEARESVVVYSLAGFGATAGKLPPWDYGSVEDLTALVLVFDEKDQCGEKIAFGFNKFGTNPELFEPETCENTSSPPCVVTATNSCGEDEPDCPAPCEEGGKHHDRGITETWDEEHDVNNNDGKTDSKGYQDDPEADAAAAAEAAAAEAAAAAAAAAAAQAAADAAASNDQQQGDTGDEDTQIDWGD
jgi:hypothetical protein